MRRTTKWPFLPWRYNFGAAVVFAVLSSTTDTGILLIPMAFFIGIAVIAALPHQLRRQPSGFYRRARQVLGWLGVLWCGTQVISVLLATVLAMTGRTEDWHTVVFQGLFGFGFALFTTQLFLAKVDPV